MTVTATIDWNAKVNEALERTAHHGVGGRAAIYGNHRFGRRVLPDSHGERSGRKSGPFEEITGFYLIGELMQDEA